MEQSLMIFPLRLDVLEKHYLEEVSLQENVDYSWSHLYDGQIEEERGS